MSIISEVYCTLQVEGTHFWPTCPLEEVSYLRDIHRHVFHIKAFKLVYHDDRDTEFIHLKHEIQDYLRHQYFDDKKRLHEFGARSCEMIARDLIDFFDLSRCEINEDGENGAILTVEPENV